MIAELYVRAGALAPLVVFIVAGLVASLVRLWWCWFTLWERECCGKAARECRCPWGGRDV